MDEELEEQMKMLEGLDLGVTSKPVMNEPKVQATTPQVQPTVSISTQQVTSQTTIPQVQPQPTITVPIQQTTPMTTIVNNTVSQIKQQALQSTTNNLDDIMNQPPVFVNLAASTYQTKTDFLTLKEGEKTRVTLVNLNFIRNHIHYIDGLGKFRCLSTYDENNRWPITRAVCCQVIGDNGKMQNAKNRLLVPVIEYPVSKVDGRTIAQNELPKLKMWDMNYVEEKALLEVLENYKTGDDFNSIDLSLFDLALSKNKADKFSTITLVPIVPSWRNQFLTQINQLIASIDKDFYNTAFKESAKVVSEETIINHLNKQIQATNQAQNIVTQINNLPNYEELMNQ